jgi:hypothetical protein
MTSHKGKAMTGFVPPPYNPYPEGPLSVHMGYAMQSLGFIGNPKKWVGKQIETVEVMAMEYGATSSVATLIRFTDGTRGWSVGHGSADGVITGPRLEAVLLSQIVTAAEKDAIRDARRRRAAREESERLAAKQAQLASLKAELGEA